MSIRNISLSRCSESSAMNRKVRPYLSVQWNNNRFTRLLLAGALLVISSKRDQELPGLCAAAKIS